jgi:hypothetical protein
MGNNAGVRGSVSGLTLETRTISARVAGGCLVIVHSKDPPGDEEWEQSIELHRVAGGGRALPTLVYTDGGAPNASQRARLNAVVGVIKPRVAVLTHSILARAAGTALTLVNSNNRIFGPNEVERALDHLGIAATSRDLVRRTLEELRKNFGGRQVATGS